MDTVENQIGTNNSKIMEAFELLNEAAKEKSHEMKELMSDRYSHIRQAVIDGTAQGKKLLDKAQIVAKDAFVEGRDVVKKTAAEADKRVREDPWPYLGGVAIAALILGYFMGSKNK